MIPPLSRVIGELGLKLWALLRLSYRLTYVRVPVMLEKSSVM